MEVTGEEWESFWEFFVISVKNDGLKWGNVDKFLERCGVSGVDIVPGICYNLVTNITS